MKKLTENLIQQRLKSCTTDLEKVLQINITGRELEDVGLLQKMTGVEILSFSVNRISNLADFRNCKNLKELYLRNNRISDIKQIFHLKNLPRLKLLTLSENPCTKDPLYRLTVIRNLKNLAELDGVPITEEERKQAQKFGKEILPNEETITGLSEATQNYQTLLQYISKPKSLEDNVIEVKEMSESEGLKKSKESIEPKEYRELNINYKTSVANNNRDFTTTENDFQTFELSSSSENNVKNEKETTPKARVKPRAPRPVVTCKYCGSQEPQKAKGVPKNYSILSAALILIKELDYSCLQIINSEILSRLNAYEIDFKSIKK